MEACQFCIAARIVLAQVSALLTCASRYFGNAKTVTPPATMATMATTISTSTSVTPLVKRRLASRQSPGESEYWALVTFNVLSFMTGSFVSLDSVQATWNAVWAVARNFKSDTDLAAWTNDSRRLSPCITR